MFVSGITFIMVFSLLSFVLSFLPQSATESLPFITYLPKPHEYIAFNNLLCGLINGVVFYAFSMYCYLYAVSLSNSEYFMMYRSTQAIFTYMVEVLVSAFTALPFLELNATDWIAATTIILSSASMVLMRTRRGKKLRQTINSFMMH